MGFVQCWAWNISCKEQLHGSICQLQPVQALCAALSGRSRKRCRLPQKQCGPWTRSQEKPSKRTDRAGNGYTYIVGRGKTETSRQVSYGFILCLQCRIMLASFFFGISLEKLSAVQDYYEPVDPGTQLATQEWAEGVTWRTNCKKLQVLGWSFNVPRCPKHPQGSEAILHSQDFLVIIWFNSWSWKHKHTPGHSMKPTLALRVAWSWRLPSSTAPLLSPIGMEGDATDVGKHEVILQSHSKLGCLGHEREFRHFFWHE